MTEGQYQALEWAIYFCDFVECGLDPRGAASVIHAQIADRQRLQAELAARDAVIEQIRALADESIIKGTQLQAVPELKLVGNAYVGTGQRLDAVLSSLPSTGETK